MMAIAATRAPDRVVDVSGSVVHGWTYREVLQDAVDFIAWAQNDTSTGRGGWSYEPNATMGDQSLGGYMSLGLLFAQISGLQFQCTVPGFVTSELSIWIDFIQDDVDGDGNDGGAGYNFPGSGNLYRTGHLLSMMRLAGDTPFTGRVQDAVDYIVRHWNDAAAEVGWKGGNRQAMFTLTKGFEFMGIMEIEVDGSPVDWYGEFADSLIAAQTPAGSWPYDVWGNEILSTEWALLVLESSARPPAVDSDGDGYYDHEDNCPKVYNSLQEDGDGDSVGDSCDNCPTDFNKTDPGVCGCGVSDVDSDSDGTPDCNDTCPNDSNKVEPGMCGCGVPDVDSDGDGTLDCNDGCPNDSAKIEPGNCGCGLPDIDSDGDGIMNCNDNCPDNPDPDQEDGDEDGVGDLCDNCLSVSNPNQADKDSDGYGNECDNCPAIFNPDQEDDDNDGLGDACENLSGDANSDGQINILDVLAVVNHILGIQVLEGENLSKADCNVDEVINILDALGIVNVILGLGQCGS